MEVGEEFDTFQQQALEITPPGNDFDPSKQPQNGEEYLMHMLYERKHCPAVVVKRPQSIDVASKSKSSPSEKKLNCDELLPNANLLPTPEWKNIQSCNFIRTRSKIMMLRQHLTKHNYNNALEPPLITDELAWHNFCQLYQPLLSVILHFNQHTLEQLLAMICDWLKGEENADIPTDDLPIEAACSSTSTVACATVLDLTCRDQWLGDWLYGVLACLHLPLEPAVHSTLRDIAMICIQLRARLKSHEFMKATPYNLFIYLIGQIFDQRDLLENQQKNITWQPQIGYQNSERDYFILKKEAESQPHHIKYKPETVYGQNLIMNSHRFQVKINLKLEAVTCPGVWLCSHGYLELTIKVLSYFFRTSFIDPHFPLLCHNQFNIEKYFNNAESIGQLVNNLSREHLQITLWQNSRRLAYYEGVLVDLLQHIEPKLQCPHINTRQLLMKTTPAFPGIIAPKVEITSQFLIKDKLLNICNTSEDLRGANILRKPEVNMRFAKAVKPMQYRRPCAFKASSSEDLMNTPHRLRKQRTVCHTKDVKYATEAITNQSDYTKLAGRHVSLESNCTSNKTNTSVGINEIECDGYQKKFENHSHENFCELCRLYKEVFLQ